jgi:guanylate kinase
MELDESLRQKVAVYKPSPEALKPIRRAPILLLAGTTGAGKDAIISQLLATYPNEYDFIVSHVTRPPRPYEKEGVDYHFIGFPAAKQLLDTQGYVEANIVHADDIYGTTINEVKRIYKEGKIATSDVTIAGCDDYVRLGLNVKAVFLLPPSYKVWQKRLNQRPDAIDLPERRRRLQSALRELRHALTTPHYYIVINDSLETTAELVNRIAHGEPVERHFHTAMTIAEELERQIAHELSTLDVRVLE